MTETSVMPCATYFLSSGLKRYPNSAFYANFGRGHFVEARLTFFSVLTGTENLWIWMFLNRLFGSD